MIFYLALAAAVFWYWYLFRRLEARTEMGWIGIGIIAVVTTPVAFAALYLAWGD